MKFATYVALMASVDAKWTPFKDLKNTIHKFHEEHPHPIKEWAEKHKDDLKDVTDAHKWLKHEWNQITKTEEELELDRIQLEQIVAGVLKGALHAEGFDDINHCIADAEEVFGDAENAYKDFKAGGTSNVINGLKELADLFKTVKAGMSDCSHIKADWEKLAKMVSIFDSPTSFAYHVGKDLIVNGRDIFHEIETAVNDYESANWSDFGYQVGEAAAKALIGEPAPVQKNNFNDVRAAEMMRGMMEAFGGNFNLEALLACIHYEDQAALILDEAYLTFKQAIADKDWQEALGGVIATVAGVQSVEQGLPACEAIDTTSFDFTGFNKAMEIRSPEYFGTKAAMETMEKAALAMLIQDFYGYGKSVGTLLKDAAPVATKDDTNVRIAAEIMQGIAKATGLGEFNLQNLLICIYQADNAAEILDQDVREAIKAYHSHSINDIMPVFILSFALYQQLEQTIPVCEQVDQLSWTKVEVSPITQNGEHLYSNGSEITYELREALQYFEEGKYEIFGEKVGKALKDAKDSESKSLFLY